MLHTCRHKSANQSVSLPCRPRRVITLLRVKVKQQRPVGLPSGKPRLGRGAKWMSKHNTANLSHQQGAEWWQDSRAKKNQSEDAIFCLFFSCFVSEPRLSVKLAVALPVRHSRHLLT